MHSYSINCNRANIRRNIILWLFCFSIIIFTILSQLFEIAVSAFPSVQNTINDFMALIPWVSPVFGGLSAFSIFGIFFWTFDNFIWKVSFIQKYTTMSDFEGTWEGVLKSSYDETKEFKVIMEITQSWSRISVVASFDESESWSDSAHIDLTHTRGSLLKFTYANRSDNPSWDIREHRGETELFLKDYDNTTGNYTVLKGDYYNNRGKNGNVGTIYLSRK